jgi:hypothetical protein
MNIAEIQFALDKHGYIMNPQIKDRTTHITWDERGVRTVNGIPDDALLPVQEPVAFYHPQNGFYWAKPTRIFAPTVVDVPPIPLYTTLPAPQRPWVDLTDEEMSECNFDADELMIDREVAKLNVQAKLKERNT